MNNFEIRFPCVIPPTIVTKYAFAKPFESKTGPSTVLFIHFKYYCTVLYSNKMHPLFSFIVMTVRAKKRIFARA